MSADEELAEVLERAHDEILVRGWGQHRITGDAGEVCANGAISCAINAHDFDRVAALYPDNMLTANERRVGRRAVEALGLIVAHRHAAGTDDIVDWNDDEDRTLDEVLDAFRWAAKSLRERES